MQNHHNETQHSYKETKKEYLDILRYTKWLPEITK